MGSYTAHRKWLPMVLEHHILLHVLPPLWLILTFFFKLILLCLGIKCWISLRLSLRPFSLFPLSPYIISTMFHGFSSHTCTNNFQMCMPSLDLFFEFCNWYLIADLVLPLLCLRGISIATCSGLNLCFSTSYLSVFQYTLPSSTHHYPFCCKSYKCKSHPGHILVPQAHFQSALLSANPTSSTSLQAITLSALHHDLLISCYHPHSPRPLQEPSHSFPVSTLAPFQSTPTITVTMNFTKGNPHHVTRLLNL